MSELNHIDLIKKCINDFELSRSKYLKMYDYYIGETDAVKTYKMITERSNNQVRVNFIKKFVKEETSYILGNKITYLSKSSNDKIVKVISENTAHWSEKHDQNLIKQALIYGTAYELYYVDEQHLFSARILNPKIAYVLADDYGNVQMFLHFFKLKFDDVQYLDVYTDKEIEHYTANGADLSLLSKTPHVFGRVPVTVCNIAEEKEYDTLFNDIKGLQDAYETNLSDISNEISDFRNAYLKFTNCKIDEKDIPAMKKLGVMQVPGEKADIQWLIKNINDSFVQNTLNTLEDKMYQLSCHINANEKLQSNTSSLALRARLIALENKCKLNADAHYDCVKNRLKIMFKFISIIKGIEYDYRDVKVKYTPMIPQDDMVMAQIISQLNGKLSVETSLAQLSFVDNVQEEMNKLKKENYTLDLEQEVLFNAGGDSIG